MSHKYLSTGNNEHPTPQKLFDSINKIFGFVCDVSATKENAKCDKFYTKEDDALKQNWDDVSIWCNPPYSKDLQPQFIKKAYESSKEYNNTIVLLIPFRPDTKVWHEYIYGKADIYIFNGRPKFYADKSPTYPSALVVFSDKNKKNVYTCDKNFEDIKMIY